MDAIATIRNAGQHGSLALGWALLVMERQDLDAQLRESWRSSRDGGAMLQLLIWADLARARKAARQIAREFEAAYPYLGANAIVRPIAYHAAHLVEGSDGVQSQTELIEAVEALGRRFPRVDLGAWVRAAVPDPPTGIELKMGLHRYFDAE